MSTPDEKRLMKLHDDIDELFESGNLKSIKIKADLGEKTRKLCLNLKEEDHDFKKKQEMSKLKNMIFELWIDNKFTKIKQLYTKVMINHQCPFHKKCNH